MSLVLELLFAADSSYLPAPAPILPISKCNAILHCANRLKPLDSKSKAVFLFCFFIFFQSSCLQDHSLGLFANLFYQLLDVIFHELDLFLFASKRLLQTDNSIHKHRFVNFRKVIHNHHRRTHLAVWRPLFDTTVPTMTGI